MKSNRKVNSILKEIEKSKNTIPIGLTPWKTMTKSTWQTSKITKHQFSIRFWVFEKYLTEYENQISKLKNFDTSKMKVEELTEFNNLGVTAIEATYEDLKKQSYDAIYELQIRIKELLKKDDLRIKDNYWESEN